MEILNDLSLLVWFVTSGWLEFVNNRFSVGFHGFVRLLIL